MSVIYFVYIQVKPREAYLSSASVYPGLFSFRQMGRSPRRERAWCRSASAPERHQARSLRGSRSAAFLSRKGIAFMHRYRVVITGLGILAPNGCGKEAFWQACLEGRSGVRTITRFDASTLSTRIAGEIPDFTPV